MKKSRVALFIMGGALVMFLASGKTTQAFHSGGVAECSGCHSMHNGRNSFLLVGSDPSSTCLTCHMHAGDTAPSSYHIATADADMPTGTAPLQRTPGGDFGWLRKTYSWVPRSGAATEYSYGQRHGHNIVAADTTLNTADPDNATAPGGTFSSSQLGCNSCHDPHGRARRLSDGSYVNAFYNPGSQNAPIIGSGSYNNSATPASGQAVGVYRLLRGLGDDSQGVTFNGVAIAVTPSSYNRTEAATQTRTAYGASGTNTWGNWCGTCHPNMHTATTGTYIHPVDESLGDIAANYNSYVKSGDLSGTNASAFTSLVPFVENTGAIATLQAHAKNDDTYLNGPATSDQVSCVSCHRAHASGFDNMLRFNMGNEFMVINGSYTGSVAVAQGRTETEMTAAYYDRPESKFATYQRVLCNKCHAKD